MKSLDEFVKKKRYLICVDSDGCAMDTMDVKHIHCFGPCMVKEWGLEEWQDQVLERWNEINLYSMTRGINRFLALAQALTEVDKNLKKIDGIEKLVQWSETADELSNSSVKAAFEQSGEQIFLKAYDWSVAVNQAIGQLPEDLQTYYRDYFFKQGDDTEETKYLWKLVKAADKLSALIKCMEEEKTGNREFVKAKESTEQMVQELSKSYPEVKDFVQEFLPAYAKTLDELN